MHGLLQISTLEKFVALRFSAVIGQQQYFSIAKVQKEERQDHLNLEVEIGGKSQSKRS